MLLNDPQFVETARVLAERLVRQFPNDDVTRAATAYRLLTGLAPNSWTRETVTRSLQQERASFGSSAGEAEKFRSIGEWPVARDLPAVEVAATASLIRALMACDESVMKP